MSDALSNFSPGQPFRPSAARENRINDTVRYVDSLRTTIAGVGDEMVPVQLWERGTLDADLTASGTATVSVTRWNPGTSTWDATTIDLTSVRSAIPSIDTITAGKVVICLYQNLKWFVVIYEGMGGANLTGSTTTAVGNVLVDVSASCVGGVITFTKTFKSLNIVKSDSGIVKNVTLT